MRLRAMVLSAGLIATACALMAQAVDVARDRVPMTELAGPWRSHAGDDPAWAVPGFDDSSWSLLRADKGWSEQEYAGYGGVARSDGGFTTCLVLRVDGDGNVTAANAGHLAPYLDGRELPLENNLPLGLSAESRYAETRLRLKPGEQITLLTDGVVEARNVRGELFGFGSTAAISMQSAETIAETARKFGQQDDVTVVRLTLDATPASKPPTFMLSGEPARI